MRWTFAGYLVGFVVSGLGFGTNMHWLGSVGGGVLIMTALVANYRRPREYDNELELERARARTRTHAINVIEEKIGRAAVANALVTRELGLERNEDTNGTRESEDRDSRRAER